MPPEKAYEKANRRIREAESTEALELDLSELALKRLPPELERLSSLQKLDPSRSLELQPTAGSVSEDDRVPNRLTLTSTRLTVRSSITIQIWAPTRLPIITEEHHELCLKQTPSSFI